MSTIIVDGHLQACVCRACERLRYKAEIERLRAALESSVAWIERWTKHVGNCEGGIKCTCGRTAIIFDARAAINQQSPQQDEKNG